eukprot:1168649-Pyramimonas_sp.AAC.1
MMMLMYPLMIEVKQNTHAAMDMVMTPRIAANRLVSEKTAGHAYVSKRQQLRIVGLKERLLTLGMCMSRSGYVPGMIAISGIQIDVPMTRSGFRRLP